MNTSKYSKKHLLLSLLIPIMIGVLRCVGIEAGAVIEGEQDNMKLRHIDMIESLLASEELERLVVTVLPGLPDKIQQKISSD
jgi:hypothetical protein